MPNPEILDFQIIDNVADTFTFYEKRIDYDGSNNPIYVGFNKDPNARAADATWYIFKIVYTGTNPTRVQQPNLLPGGQGFKYVWNDRTTYFS